MVSVPSVAVFVIKRLPNLTAIQKAQGSAKRKIHSNSAYLTLEYYYEIKIFIKGLL